MDRFFVTIAALSGFVSVALGALGAHGLRSRLGPLTDGAARLAWWETAAQYHLAHALALGLVAGLLGTTRAGRVASLAFSVGTLLFSGSLYALALSGQRWLGHLTPFGGLALLTGWAAFAYAALRLRP